MSLKTKALSMSKNSTTVKLEVENRKMEQRLEALRHMMSAEKARRELDGGIHWQSGKSGPLHTPSKQSSTTSRFLQNSNSKPIKVKVLTDQNARTKQKSSALPQCGQCDKTAASLSCVECIENYCQLCFAKMHQKGSLLKHHVKPILHKVKQLSTKTTHGAATNTNSTSESTPLSPSKDKTSESQSLLDGTYDEASSAKSFQEALAEWRNGKDSVSSKSCNTHHIKDNSAETNSEVATVTGGIQVGPGSISQGSKTAVSVEFSNKIGLTYFEKLMVRRFKDGSTNTVNYEQPGQTEQHHNEFIEELEDEDEVKPIISEYNIFYSDEDDIVSGKTYLNDEVAFDGFDLHTPSAVTFEEISVSNGVSVPSECNEPIVKSEVKEKPSRPKDSTSRLTKARSKSDSKCGQKRKLESKKVHSKEKKSEKRSAGADQLSEEQSTSTHQLKQSDILASLKLAWSTCSQSGTNNPQLAQFFLHGVNPMEMGTTPTQQPLHQQPNDQLSTASQFRLGSTIWLPVNSTVEGEIDDVTAQSESTEPLTLQSNYEVSSSTRPSTRECRDLYYDETDSDSEPEGEREAFICSRLGIVSDSMESEKLRLPSRQDLEDEEQHERDEADRDALECLAWELASTIDCEGQSSRCETKLDQLDLERDGMESDLVMKWNGEEEKTEEEQFYGDEVGEVDMDRVISEFEIHQQELMEQEYQ